MRQSLKTQHSPNFHEKQDIKFIQTSQNDVF